ncbi:hypothetical protein [Leptospira paudalimensis]|uniref:Lipoprotein n=1 Tax=Leptospira paudalimensis TaxID=2950024 RepID=A0ABT3M4F0_9LEPT|nr:hypothetical protein [Leptospira paudalimensis]MCW7503270.1 hypothetical protein [Leptospira paudalimensis]
MLKINFLFLLLLTLGCNSVEYRIQNPSKTEEKNQTLVGFLILDDYKFNAKDPNLSEVDLSSIAPSDFVIYDYKTKSPELSLLIDKKNPKYVEEDGEKISYGKSLDLLEAAYLLDSKKEYYLGFLQWNRFCNFCNNPVRAKLVLEPQKSFSTLKIKGKPGEIVFLGIYTVAMKKEEKEVSLRSFFSLSSEDPNMIVEFDRANPDSPIWKKKWSHFSSFLHFDREHGFNERSAEIAFLKKIIKTQNKGYWKDKAEKRLNEILASKK